MLLDPGLAGMGTRVGSGGGTEGKVLKLVVAGGEMGEGVETRQLAKDDSLPASCGQTEWTTVVGETKENATGGASSEAGRTPTKSVSDN